MFFKIGDIVKYKTGTAEYELINAEEIKHLKHGQVYKISNKACLMFVRKKKKDEKTLLTESDREAVCEFCMEHYEMAANYLCEGRFCETALALYLDDNPTKAKESDMNKNISEVFDKTKDALLVEKHLGDEIKTGFIAGLILEDKKEEVLEEAKRREAELNEDK